MNWYLEVLKKYVVFSGRARRKEFWFFVLFNFIAGVLISLVDMLLGTYNTQAGIGTLGSLYSLAVLLPSLAVAVRRLHDTGRTGWWLLLMFVPLIGVLVLIVFWVLDSQPGDNKYGPNPKAQGPATPGL